MCNAHGINNLNPAYPYHTDCLGDGTLYDPDSDGPTPDESRPPCPHCDPAGFRKWAKNSAADHGETLKKRKSILAAIDEIIELARRQNDSRP